MTSAPSILSLLAAVFYLVVAGAAIAAWLSAARERQVRWHRVLWITVAALFVGFAVVRFYGIEDWVRGDLRMMLYAEQSYDDRRTIQKPLFAALFIIAMVCAAGFVTVLARKVQGRRNIAAVVAGGCTGGLIALMATRLVSLHSFDVLLYGPLKLNWFADLGLTIAVLVCAVRYCLIVRGR